MKAFLDLHHHILWGMDDGPDSMEESRRMLHIASKEGIGTIAATPHIYPGYRPFDWKMYRQRLNALRAICARDNLPIRLIEGAEIHFTSSALNMLQEKRLPTMDGTPYVLIEFGDRASFDQIESAVYSLFRNGYLPIIAHPERCRSLVLSPKRAIRLREEFDLSYQLDCINILRPIGILQKMFIHRMLSARAIDIIATDAHDSALRTPKMRAAWEYVRNRYGRKYADSLVTFDLHARR